MKKLNLHKEFSDLARLCYNIDVINNSLDNVTELVKISEKMYRDQIKQVVDTTANKGYKMILVSGPSSSGKTTTANFIGQELVKKNIGSLVVSIDDFFVDLADTPLLPDGTPDCENISAVDIATFNKFFSELLKKGKAKMPRFNFKKHKRDAWETVTLQEHDVLIVEGIHALNPALLLTNEFDNQIYKVYACTNSKFYKDDKIIIHERDLRLMRRTYRDAFTRGRLPIDTIKQWKNVCEGERTYISPYKTNADVFIDSTHPYEIMIYSNYLSELLLPYADNDETKRLLDIFKQVNKLSKDCIPHDSLLWEFLVYKED